MGWFGHRAVQAVPHLTHIMCHSHAALVQQIGFESLFLWVACEALQVPSGEGFVLLSITWVITMQVHVISGFFS